MKFLPWLTLVFSVLLYGALVVAEQPQQQQPKNYPALIAQQGRAMCEESLASILKMNDDLQVQVAKLKAELAEAKKPAPVPEAK